MITLQDIERATFDDTSIDEFDRLLTEYCKQNPASEESKQRFRELMNEHSKQVQQ